MTPHIDPCCHGAGVAASTRPRTATPLINHLGHRIVTALCAAPGAREGSAAPAGTAAPGRLSATSRPVSAGPAGLLLARLLEAAGVKRKGGKERGHFLKAVNDYIECELVGSQSWVQSWELGGSQPEQGPLSGVAFWKR